LLRVSIDKLSSMIGKPSTECSKSPNPLSLNERFKQRTSKSVDSPFLSTGTVDERWEGHRDSSSKSRITEAVLFDMTSNWGVHNAE
jgi:hypothetical protein